MYIKKCHANIYIFLQFLEYVFFTCLEKWFWVTFYTFQDSKHSSFKRTMSPIKDIMKKDKRNGKYIRSETVQYGKFWRDEMVITITYIQ